MNEIQVQSALNGLNVNIDALERAGYALSVGHVTYVPHTGERRELLHFQLFMEDVRELAESKNWRKVQRWANTPVQDNLEPETAPTTSGDEPLVDIPAREDESTKCPEIEIAEEIVPEREDSPVVVRELGTPEALIVAEPVVRDLTKTVEVKPEPVADPSRYTVDLAQAFEFLRDPISLMQKFDVDQAVIQMLLNAAVEARDHGSLKTWKAHVVPGITGSIGKGRHPNEFIPSMLTYLRTKVVQARFQELDSATQAALRHIAPLVPEAHKSTHADFIDNSIASGKVKHFAPAWDEVQLGIDEDRVSAPWSLWKKIVNERWNAEETERMRQPIQIKFEESRAWLKPWMPPYDKALINTEHIIHDFQVSPRRLTVEHRVEAAYGTLYTDIKDYKRGAGVETLIAAWSSPSFGPQMSAAWFNGMCEAYNKDGKCYAFSQQQFDVNAAAFFLDIMQRPSCAKWVELNRDNLINHPKLGSLYARLFPATPSVSE
jgi:hypothetical protein